jgi:hypothetical protein
MPPMHEYRPGALEWLGAGALLLTLILCAAALLPLLASHSYTDVLRALLLVLVVLVLAVLGSAAWLYLLLARHARRLAAARASQEELTRATQHMSQVAGSLSGVITAALELNEAAREVLRMSRTHSAAMVDSQLLSLEDQ